MHTVVAGAEPSWTRRARRYLGVKETPGPRSTAEINRFHSFTRAGPVKEGDSDAVHWCSSFQCCVFEEEGIRSPRSKSAIDWLKWGRELDAPQIGCIMVIKRRDPANPRARHVTQYVGVDGQGRFLGLGGNQGNAVSIHPYDRNDIESFRWPESP
jgi:uncharacterized protein (TIGR02594 family)